MKTVLYTKNIKSTKTAFNQIHYKKTANLVGMFDTFVQLSTFAVDTICVDSREMTVQYFD